MSAKLKGLFAVLMLGALASLVSFANWFGPSSNPGSVYRAQSLGLIGAPRDSDGDGLSDEEETYWGTDFQNADSDGDGFLDGEEVLSGHNPALAGPNDWLSRSENLTERTTQLAVGAILSGDLTPGGTKYNSSLDLLSEDVLSRYRENITIEVDKLTLMQGDSREDRENYVTSMAWILSGVIVPAIDDAEQFLLKVADVTYNDASALTGDPQRYLAYATEARRLARETGERAAKVADTPVPYSFAIQHRSAIRLLRILQRQYELSATIKEDPIQGMLALQAVVQMHIETLPAFVADFAQTITNKLTYDL